MSEGHIMIHQSIIYADWYKDHIVFSLFLHFLLTSRKYELETDARKLSAETGLTEKQIRKAIRTLKTMGRIQVFGDIGNVLIKIKPDDTQYKL